MENIRFLLVIAFAMIILMLWQAWQMDYGPKQPISQIENQSIGDIKKQDIPIAGTGIAQQSAEQQLALPLSKPASKEIISVKTDVLALEIDTVGGTIQNLDLLDYPKEKENTFVDAIRKLIGLPASEKDHSPVRLFDSSPEKEFLAQSGIIAAQNSSPGPDHYAKFGYQQKEYVLADGQDTLNIPLTWVDSTGMTVTKTFIFKRNSYEITLNQTIQNNSGQDWVGRQYSQLLRVPHKEGQGNMLTAGMRAYDGGVVYTQKDKYQKIDFDDMVDKNLDVVTEGGWAAMIQHYFASAWIPPAEQDNHFYTKHLPEDYYVIGSYSPEITISNNSEATLASRLFSGPKIQPIMEKVAPGLELTVDYSVLTFIGKPIYSLLNLIHGVTKNWGFAIIGVTLCIKLLMFPLTQASFLSMAKMRKIQPRLKELQERFKDDRQRFNTEMMALYKKEKVNPLGGCLPILIQIPVFMSLYWVLSETVEFRQAPFMLWIQDLSAMDPFFVLPIVMGITMKIQQGLNPPPIDPVQAKVMKLFPYVFTVFFLFFPAGLVLYWVVNNTLSILQQTYIAKKVNALG